MIYTDTHAHLSLVARELGDEVVAGLLDEYAAAWAIGASASGGGASGDGALSGSASGDGALLIDVGVEAGDLRGRMAALGERAFLRYTAGIWPSAEALAEPAAHLDALESAIASLAPNAGVAQSVGTVPNAGLAAIGECGLDYHHMNGTPSAQRELFSDQIELAERLGLPLIVHSRDAAADTLAILRSAGPRSAGPRIPVVLHCFGYGPGELEDFLDLGCYISFAGNLTFKSARPLREACALVPRNRLLLETDAPYMNPEPRRGQPSTSADIARTYAAAAELRSVTVGDLARTVSDNARRLFSAAAGTEAAPALPPPSSAAASAPR